VQRQLPVQVPFRARDFRAVESPGDADLDALGAETHRAVDRATHGPAEGDALDQLLRNPLGHQLRIQLGLVDFLDPQIDVPPGEHLEILLQLLDLRAFFPHDDSGAGSENDDGELVGRPLDFHARDARVPELLLQHDLEIQVFVKQRAVVLAGEPSRAPSPDNS
jgi:hypothetical protein